MCDDIYEAITYGNNQFCTLVEVAPDLHDRVLTVNGVSKSHAMTGWRIGFAGGPTDLISAMSKIQGQSTTNASSVGQAAALAALQGSQENLGVWNLAYTRRMRLVRDRLSVIPGLTLRDPQGAFYHFIKCSGLFGKTTPQGDQLTSDNALCLYLLQYAHVALVAGTEFGCPGYFRLCFAKSDQELIKACDSISEAIELLT
jgi:aspartate aminotransferase